MKLQVFLKTRFDRCTGCRLCQMACSFRLHQGYNPDRSLLRIEASAENLYHFPTVCSQCSNAYCANVCPTGAITRDSRTGALSVDSETCVGCGLCVRYCPVTMIYLDPDSGKAVTCDLCDGDPVCVDACPTGALELATLLKTPGEV